MALPPHPALASRPPTWQAEFWRRISHRVWLKAAGTTLFMALFFTAYFALLRHPAFAVLQMPLTAVDRWVPFQPAWLVLYLSLWVYVGIAPNLLLTLRELVGYTLWVAALCGTGLACFYFWPTAVPPMPSVDLSQHAAFALLQGVDAAGNACPSMHVASAVFSAAWIERLLRDLAMPRTLRCINVAWMLGIAYSTLAVRQHVFYDVLSGTLLGALFAWASLRRFPGPSAQDEAAIIRTPGSGVG